MFTAREVLPGVHHIQDAMGVCMTLLTGEARALLVDTGYGLEDAAAFVRTLTDRPLTVLLTHGHHDHALGARWFDRVLLFPEDLPVYREYTSEKWRRHVLNGAREKGIAADEAALLAADMPPAEALTEDGIDLGGLTALVIRAPGHTPGSAAVYVPERALLLTGDDWNPTTWCFFPEACGEETLLQTDRRLQRLPFRSVLCSHQPVLFPREKLDFFLDSMTPEALISKLE